MREPVRLLETMRAARDDAGPWQIPLEAAHLARLAHSAAAWGYPCQPDRVRQVIAAALRDPALDALGGEARLRLTLGPALDLDVTVGPRLEPPATAWIDPEPLREAGSRYCIHKTTARAFYDACAARARARGADEALLVGPDGAMVEGTRTSLWILRDGRWWTPPLAAGGLPGVMRAHLLATHPGTAEAVLYPDDVWHATAVRLSNAVAGWVDIRVLPPTAG